VHAPSEDAARPCVFTHTLASTDAGTRRNTAPTNEARHECGCHPADRGAVSALCARVSEAACAPDRCRAFAFASERSVSQACPAKRL
jgi:hypothetical protein